MTAQIIPATAQRPMVMKNTPLKLLKVITEPDSTAFAWLLQVTSSPNHLCSMPANLTPSVTVSMALDTSAPSGEPLGKTCQLQSNQNKMNNFET
jgi:hypothetical protein